MMMMGMKGGDVQLDMNCDSSGRTGRWHKGQWVVK